MAEAGSRAVTCPSCGKKYRWQPNLARRKVRCGACQAMILMPLAAGGAASLGAAAPAAAPAGRPGPLADPNLGAEADDGAYDLVLPGQRPSAGAPPPETAEAAALTGGDPAKCPNCGTALKAGTVICINCGFNVQQRAPIAVDLEAEDPPALAAAAPPADNGLGAMMAQRLARVKPKVQDDDVAAQHRRSDIYVPAMLAGIGLVLVLFNAFYLAPNPFAPRQPSAAAQVSSNLGQNLSTISGAYSGQTLAAMDEDEQEEQQPAAAPSGGLSSTPAPPTGGLAAAPTTPPPTPTGGLTAGGLAAGGLDSIDAPAAPAGDLQNTPAPPAASAAPAPTPKAAPSQQTAAARPLPRPPGQTPPQSSFSSPSGSSYGGASGGYGGGGYGGSSSRGGVIDFIASLGRFALFLGAILSVVLKIPFMFMALIAVAKLFGTAFDGVMVTILKLTAVAVMLTGVDGIVYSLLYIITEGAPGLGFMIRNTVVIATFWALASWLFDLDFLETFVLYLLAFFVPTMLIFCCVMSFLGSFMM